jgi:succinoglycan biosynthesis transport protein ExoP
MASIDESQAVDDAAHRAVRPAQPEIGDLLGIARRGWLFMAAGTTLGLICAMIILSMLPPTYKASARIAFERTLPRYMQTNKVSNEPIIDDYDTLGQAYVISSESVLLQVVRSLSLASDPDFAGGGKDSKTLSSRIRGLVQNIAQALGLPKEPADDQSPPHHSSPEKIAFDSVARNLTVSREDVASVLTIAFSWKDPVKAATIANSIVDTYLNESIAEKMKSANVARKVVQERVEELKQQIKEANRALLEYRAANNLVGSDQLTLTQVGTLQTQMTSAQLAMAEAKARMARIASDPDARALFAPDNELIKKLRGELLDLSVRASDIEKLVGKDHLAAVKLRDRMEEVSQAIASEQGRMVKSFDKDYELAHARYDELSATISQVASSEGVNPNKQSRLRELESAVDTLRSLYNRMLQQVSEMNRVETQPPSITPDARILVRADLPSQTESSKKRLLILASGSVMGLLLGSAILLASDFPFGVFRTCQQVTSATALPCTVLPKIVGVKEQASLRAGEYALDAPYSRFAQTMRGVGAMIGIAQRESDVKVVCVVSSNPGEGKTTVAMNLAAHFGRHATTRVLLIDADFYRQSLTKSIAPDARVGLKEALEEPTGLAKLVVRKERLNLDALPCPVPDQIPNPAELLGIVELERLIEVAREAYDLVIIEAPPMAAIADYKIIARRCDGFILVVEWGKTSQRLVLECLSDASALLDRVLCVILNKADPSALRSIEHYKGARFHAYYGDQKRA